MTTSLSHHLDVTLATAADRPVLEQLWTMFRHDMSAYSGAIPDSRGRYRQDRLDSALHDPAWAGYLLRLGTSPVGLGLVRGLNQPERILSSFFLVHGARRNGHGRTAIRTITQRHPGPWAVAFQDANITAAQFWRSVAAHADEHWSVAHQDVPGRPDLPPDSWLRFRVRSRAFTGDPLLENNHRIEDSCTHRPR